MKPIIFIRKHDIQATSLHRFGTPEVKDSTKRFTEVITLPYDVLSSSFMMGILKVWNQSWLSLFTNIMLPLSLAATNK